MGQEDKLMYRWINALIHNSQSANSILTNPKSTWSKFVSMANVVNFYCLYGVYSKEGLGTLSKYF